MSNFLETKIREIDDPDFQSLFAELCHCIDKNPALFSDHPLSYLLMVIGQEDPKALAIQYLPGPGILTMKVGKLLPDSVVHAVCQELVNLRGTHIESFDGKTVLSLIKSCYQVFVRGSLARRSQRGTNDATNSQQS